jgi:hypothetical protein
VDKTLLAMTMLENNLQFIVIGHDQQDLQVLLDTLDWGAIFMLACGSIVHISIELYVVS